MFMMIMLRKRRVSASLTLLALSLASVSCILPPSKEDLSELSLMGEKYLDKQIENAVNGVKEMKGVMEKTTKDHEKILTELEKTKQQKDEALHTAHELEAKLEQEEEKCNGTMQILWLQCKPCLKTSCVRFYSRTCSSGSGLVGRQLEGVLNRTSPISIWVNGQNLDSLDMEDQQQNDWFSNLEDSFDNVGDGVDSIFRDSMKVFDHMRSFHTPFFSMPFRMPSLWFPGPVVEPEERPSRLARSPLQDPDFHGFQSMFLPMMGMSRNVFSSVTTIQDLDGDLDTSNTTEEVVITKPSADGKMVCKEIRRNSAGCIPKLRDECQKCKDILEVDCSGKKVLDASIKKDMEEALARAESLSKMYAGQLKHFEERMLNVSSILDGFNKQFGWVSALTNITRDIERFFRIQDMIFDDQEKPDGQEDTPRDTNVAVQLFDAPTMRFTVPGDIPWSDPKFSEVVAQKALDQYKESTITVK